MPGGIQGTTSLKDAVRRSEGADAARRIGRRGRDEEVLPAPDETWILLEEKDMRPAGESFGLVLRVRDLALAVHGETASALFGPWHLRHCCL